MKKLMIIFLFSIPFCMSISTFAAVKIVECEDEEGNRSFYKKCPPGMTIVGEKKVSTGAGTVENVVAPGLGAKKSATLYVIPACDTCDEVREFLKDNEVSITEIDVSSDYEVQTKFEAIAGELRVPVTVIDGQVIHGYKRSEFKTALGLDSESAAQKTEEETEKN
ncbi:MAG: glutaredoxin family protein [Proteobacteria bacterium]|nr:glutaredoxin family protein [Pseudomonadota bacterium]